MARRTTKTNVRDALREMTAAVLALKNAVDEDSGLNAVTALQEAEEVLEDVRGLLEDRYDDAFTELEGEIVEEGAEEEVEEEEETEEEEPS